MLCALFKKRINHEKDSVNEYQSTLNHLFTL